MDIDELVRALRDGDETSEDRTLHSRERPGRRGIRVDFEVIERTSFEGAYPETVREFRSKQPLDCHHQVSRENPFVGYCAGKRFLFRSCGKEFCSFCAVQCPECGRFVSASCCARNFEGELLCKGCRRLLRLKKSLRFVFVLLLNPFLSEGVTDERQEKLFHVKPARGTAVQPTRNGLGSHAHADDDAIEVE